MGLPADEIVVVNDYLPVHSGVTLGLYLDGHVAAVAD